MATWGDDIRETFGNLAKALEGISGLCDYLIKTALEDEDITVLVDTRDWCRDRACIFRPPGEPQQGYPQDGADVISLDAYREWARIEKRQA